MTGNEASDKLPINKIPPIDASHAPSTVIGRLWPGMTLVEPSV
jgi:hypothetical protein